MPSLDKIREIKKLLRQRRISNNFSKLIAKSEVIRLTFETDPIC